MGLMKREAKVKLTGSARHLVQSRLSVAFFVLAALNVGIDSPRAKGAVKRCGAIDDFAVKVEKGEIGCEQARGIATRFIQRDGCGTSMRPACVVGKFHCRVATPGERGLAGYCYRLKKPVPPEQDFSFYKPRRFRAAITLSVNQQNDNARHSALAEVSRTCRTGTQNIEARRNISCARAKKVAAKAYESDVRFPECPGDKAKRWNGWRLTAKPVDGLYVGTRFAKGKKAFTLSGGGAC